VQQKYKILKIYSCFVFFVAGVLSAYILNFQVYAATVIENNVSASANSGENTVSGSGDIRTGDAKAESKVDTNVSGDDETKVKVKASAEANGQKETVEKESTGANQEFNVDVSAEIDGNEADIDPNVSDQVEPASQTNIQTETNQNQKDSGFFAKTMNSIDRGIEKVLSTIAEIFS
jgi:hypothetical protein